MPSKKPSALKQSLLDFQSEMKGKLLDDEFTVHGKKWKMKMLNEEEQMWSTSMMNTTTVITTALSGRLANLAIGIREIDDTPVYEYFTEDWDELEEREQEALQNMNRFAIKYFVAEHLHSILAEMPPNVITDLWNGWNELVERRAEAQEMSKKSSGETSPEVSNES